MSLTIIEATVQHAVIICEIAHKTWYQAYLNILSERQIGYMLNAIYAPQKIKSQIIAQDQKYLLLENESGEFMAFASYSKRENSVAIYKLHKLYCLPEMQLQGGGKLLIGEIINRVISNGGHTLDLNVNRYNPAVSFYEKMGFKVIRKEDIAIGPYWMNDYVMRIQIS